ncbi:Peroxidase 52 [Glycine max]|nr:Peroxidase 52 [Glycine max]
MAFHKYFSFVLYVFVFAAFPTTAFSKLSHDYYDYTCPNALSTIRSVVEAAVQKERRMGASLLRLHFHDCFVNGCDGSILLDPSSTIDSEKNALPNFQSARGFEVVDEIKEAVDEACGKPVVSCADILAVAARDSVVALGGPSWKVRLGRRDSTTASREAANANIPAPFFSLSELINNFKSHGLNERDLVALSGGHTIGNARCATFRDHIYNDSNINPHFAKELKHICPREGGDSNLAPLDRSAARFDSAYFSDLVHKKGLLHSDQELFNGGSTDALVKIYSHNTKGFHKDFAKSMIKMGNIKPLTGNRVTCNKQLCACPMQLVGPTWELSELINNFKSQGLNEKDLIAFSRGHTIGNARCATFRDHIYNDSNVNSHFAKELKCICLREGGDSSLAPLNHTVAQFEMGNINPLTGNRGEIRLNCRKVN